MRVPRKFNSLFILYISTAKAISLARGYIEVKISKQPHQVGFDPTNFQMSKIYQGNFQSLCRLAQLFLNTSAVVIQKKERNRWRKFFPCSENAIWLILLKYQEINVQIQAFTDQNCNIVAFLNGTKCQPVEYKY